MKESALTTRPNDNAALLRELHRAQELVERLAAIGAAGCNLEDTDHTSGALADASERADRISFGPAPFLEALEALKAMATRLAAHQAPYHS
jgi:hypothetical protein